MNAVRVQLHAKSFPWIGWTPVHIAAWLDRDDIVSWLVEQAGASVSLLNEHCQVGWFWFINNSGRHLYILQHYEEAIE